MEVQLKLPLSSTPWVKEGGGYYMMHDSAAQTRPSDSVGESAAQTRPSDSVGEKLICYILELLGILKFEYLISFIPGFFKFYKNMKKKIKLAIITLSF